MESLRRAAKVDACLSAPEPSWILDDTPGTGRTTQVGGSNDLWPPTYHPIEHGGPIRHILEEEEAQRYGCETDWRQVRLNIRNKVRHIWRSGPRHGFRDELDEDASGPDGCLGLVILTPGECIMDEDGRNTDLLPNDPIESMQNNLNNPRLIVATKNAPCHSCNLLPVTFGGIPANAA